ncbi:MAG: tryptophan synthase subunit alpha [Candidatus Thermoplasmatota archaeon]|nr:tryptophan synthase subunit alpha [Candidatus Thermoplasmatota archaeon]
MKNRIILYFTIGFPDNPTLQEFSEAIPDHSLDYVELGYPSRRAYYDGPRIRETHEAGLKNFNVNDLAQLTGTLQKKARKIYLLTYHDDFTENRDNIYSILKSCNFSGLIIPDLLTDYYDENSSIIEEIQGSGYEYIPFFNPSSPDKVITSVSGISNSWIYYGLMPSTGINVPYSQDEVVSRINSIIGNREINFGFGIRSIEDVKRLFSYGAHGAAIGTLLIEMLKSHDTEGFKNFVSELAVTRNA